MYIRKRSFFEIVFPLTIVFFVCIGTSFLDAIGAQELRFVFILLLFAYLLLNKKLLIYIDPNWKMILLVYLVWCISTTLWSEVPILSISKSTLFIFNIIMLLSAGSLWVIKYDYKRCLSWLLLVLITALLSGVMGASSRSNFDSYGTFLMYAGLNGNPNAFGFLVAIISPLIYLKLYQHVKNRWRFFLWLSILLIDAHYLISSYSRSSIAIFLCVTALFLLSLPLSKKILVTILSFFLVLLILIMTPVSYFESVIASHMIKSSGGIEDPHSSILLQSRSLVWKESYQHALEGGVMGGGFSVNISHNHFSDNDLMQDKHYSREKGNSQLAIWEETGIIGLILYACVLISFFISVIPTYFRLSGANKVSMGLVLGAIIGLFMESIVEAWWDAPAGPEFICFWSLVGVAQGMVYLGKKIGKNDEHPTNLSKMSF